MQFSLVKNDDGSGNVTVFVDGNLKVAHSDNPNFDKIVEGALAGDDSIVDLFDLTACVAARFEPLSERVSVADGRVYLDGDEVDNALTQAIVRFLDEDVDDWRCLVAFFENVQNNPSQHSREQLYAWLSRNTDFTITRLGNILAYKGVDANFNSVWSGGAIVNGEKVSGHVPNKVGSTIEMPRSAVTHDPAVGCSTGLHVATHAFATGYGSTVLSVEVNPRDVVSVPTECDAEKMRVCRYEVRGVVESAYEGVVIEDDDDDDLIDW